MDSKKVPTYRCLICNLGPCFDSSSLAQHKKVSETISQHLEVIFILSKVLEVPKENLQTYLMTWGSPQVWLSMCSKCKKLVREAKSIYDEMLRSLKNFRGVQEKIVGIIRRTSSENVGPPTHENVGSTMITNVTRQFVTIHDYGSFTDPFVTGDRRANQILQNQEWNDLMKIDEVKQEILSDSNMEDAPVDPDLDSAVEVNNMSDGKISTLESDNRMVDELRNASYQGVEKDCNRAFRTQKDLGNHLVKDHGKAKKVETFEKCMKCGLTFPTDKFSLHMDMHHPDDDPNAMIVLTAEGIALTPDCIFAESSDVKTPLNKAKVESSPVTFTFECHICLKQQRYFRDQELLDQHLQLHKSSPHHCFICLSVFRDSAALARHICNSHPEHKPPPSRAKPGEGKKRKQLGKDSKGAKKNKTTLPKTRTTRSKKAQIIETSDEDEADYEDAKDGEVLLGDDEWRPVTESKVRRTQHSEQEKSLQNQADEENIIYCPLCATFTFSPNKREKLCEHLETCKGNDNDNEVSQVLELSCPLCNNYKCYMNEKSNLIEHVIDCRGTSIETGIGLTDRIFKCNLCPQTKYMKLNTFLEHFMFHKKNIYKCSKCPRRFNLNIGLNAHWRLHHKDYVNVQSSHRYTTDFSTPEVPWWCEVCNEKFSDDESRDLHLQTIHHIELSKTHMCQECSKGYSSPEELKLHQCTSHVSSTSEYKCDVCQQHFLTSKLLRLHIRDNHLSDLFVCDVCGTECRSRSAFKTHLQLHKEVKDHVCDVCGRSFTTSQYLRNHKFQEHVPPDDTINPCTCPICKKKFNNPSYRNKHIMSVHEKRHRYSCDKCGNGFLERSKLKLHLVKIHGIGESKKHICPVEDCKKEFWMMPAFRSHMSRHENKPQFKCEYCGKEFFCNSHRRRHEKIHTNAETKPYQCEICNKRFPVRNYLYIHMKSHKNKQEVAETE
ncbi:unnamed protein product [Orchesella dallaii]|uniref:C2H2-type domain-containing protein n=1 Tax=Orchesella dallaii TaxID=48710 RepID=A0ABP1RVU7_9HEXA